MDLLRPALLSLEPTQALGDIGLKALSTQFTIAWDVDADFGLFAHHIHDPALNVARKPVLIVWLVEHACLHAFQDGRRSDQAADVRGKDAVSAALQTVVLPAAPKPRLMTSACPSSIFTIFRS
jgi:hypothetical protein